MTTTTATPAATTEATDADTVDDTRTWGQRTAETARNRAANAAIRARADARSAVFRNRRQLQPFKFTGATAALGGLGAATDHAETVSTLMACGGTGLAATGAAVGTWWWLREHIVRQWHRRVQLGLAGAAAWSAIAPLADQAAHWAGLGLALSGGTVGLAARYWQHHRPGYPDPPEPPPEVEADPEPDPGPEVLPEIIDNWNRNVAKRGGALTGATIRDNGSITNGQSYWVQLSAGDQTLGAAQAAHHKIAGGLRISPQKLLIESAGTTDPNDLELRVVARSPITSTVYFERPSYRVNSEAIGFVDLGPYADGEGCDAGYALYGPNSMYNGYSAGGTGSGKTKLSETVGLTALSDQAPPTVLVYLDGQSGDSSASLWQHALWRGGPDKARGIATGLLEMMSYRGKYIQWRRRKHGGGGFAPTPDMPGILVIVDECHAIFDVAGDLFNLLARQGRKNGIGTFATSQLADLTVFGKGGDGLRSSLIAGNGIGLRLDSNVQNTVFTGLNADLTQLPPGGYGYTTSGKDVAHRTAQFRTRFLLDQGDAAKLTEAGVQVPNTVRLVEDWFAELAPRQHLSDDMGKVAGEEFLNRHAEAASEDADLDDIFECGGDPVELFKNRKNSTPAKSTTSKNSAADSEEDEGNVTPLFAGGFGDLAPTLPPDGVDQRDLKPREQQLLALFDDDNEELSVSQAAEELGISERAVRSLIRSLGETRLSKVRPGVYRRR